MSQHSQRTQQGPSVSSVVVSAICVVASTAGTAYVFSGPGFTPREAVGCLLGAALIGATLGRTVALVAERAVVQYRMERTDMDRQRMQALAEQARRAAREREELAAEMNLVEPDTSGPIPLTPPMYASDRWNPDLTEPMRAVDDHGRPTDPVRRMADDGVARYLEEEMEYYRQDGVTSIAVPLPPRVDQPEVPPGWNHRN